MDQRQSCPSWTVWQKVLQGQVQGTAGGDIRLATEAGETRLPFGAIARAKLVITEDLISASERRRH